MTALRKVLLTLVGHVDHGKTSLLDRIRQSTVAAGEAGAITQSIGASVIPIDVVKKICGQLLQKLNAEITLPGLLAIDTPGHAAFTHLRKRGGALADIAILVVDINEGFKPQTVEAVEILKANKVPFVVAANKIDLLPGWKANKEIQLVQSIRQQAERVQEAFDAKLYALVEQLHNLGFQSERFDRVEDVTKQIVIVPISAMTGEGVPELLMMLVGLAQRFFEKKLTVELEKPAKGTILEVKEEKGLGTTIDAIIYDGSLRVNDVLVIGGTGGPFATKVRALLEPAPLQEMRVKKTQFRQVNEIFAATGVKIVAPDLDKAAAGMPVRGCSASEIEQIKLEIIQEVSEVLIETDNEGVIIKADSLGSLEALITLLRGENIPIASASLGNVAKKDLVNVEAMKQRNPFTGVLLGFNVVLAPEAKEYLKNKEVPTILRDVIYHIIESYAIFKEDMKKALEKLAMQNLIRPSKVLLLRGYVFRQNNPAVVGVEVLVGRVRAGDPLMSKEGKKLAEVKSIQVEQESVTELEKGKQAAIAMDGVSVGRQINEGDILYTDLTEDEFMKLREYRMHLKKDEIEALKEIAEMKRKENPVWGIR